MNFLFLVLMAFISFGGFVLCQGFFKNKFIYVFAIGGIVSANIFNTGTYPITIGNLVFGLDSVIYTIFIFCVIYVFITQGKKEAFDLTYSSMASVLFSGFIQFIASWSNGSFEAGINWLTSFLTCIIATYLAIIFSIFIFEKAKKVINTYVNIAIFILNASIINSLIYFGVNALLTGTIGINFWGALAGSYIGKAMCIGFSLLTFWLCEYIINKTHKSNLL